MRRGRSAVAKSERSDDIGSGGMVRDAVGEELVSGGWEQGVGQAVEGGARGAWVHPDGSPPRSHSFPASPLAPPVIPPIDSSHSGTPWHSLHPKSFLPAKVPFPARSEITDHLAFQQGWFADNGAVRDMRERERPMGAHKVRKEVSAEARSTGRQDKAQQSSIRTPLYAAVRGERTCVCYAHA